MLIALDYDDTFTRDPLGWAEAVTLLKKRGARVVGCTMRYEREGIDLHPGYVALCETIIFTGRVAKRKHLATLDVFPDVWIDDTPEFICHSASS